MSVGQLALFQHDARPQPDPRMQEALLTSVEAMRGPLEAESAEYEALRHGGVAAFAVPPSPRSPSSSPGRGSRPG